MLEILANGLGPLDSPAQTGNNSLDKLRQTTTPLTVLIGNVQSQIQFSGLSPSFVGVYQVNAVVPQVSAGNAVTLQLQMGGITSAASAANIAVSSN